MDELLIRDAKKEDLEQVVDLIVRMKRLSGEFDPLFMVVDDAQQKAVGYLQESIGRRDRLVLVAVNGSRIFAVLRAEIKHRIFYNPAVEGDITDFYILPEARRKALGRVMIDTASARLKKMGAEMIVAEFPSQNEIANRFYEKRGFRPLMNKYAKDEQGTKSVAAD